MNNTVDEQLKIALEALQRIEEDSDDCNSRNLAQHAQIKIMHMKKSGAANQSLDDQQRLVS